ncbi:MAG: hypothetical protein KF729_18720 [Sandaracinaceae bacterium]|nr:hypothetical protein [Sandaracinaceae bacterium]
MNSGSRVTDAAHYHVRRNEMQGAVRVVRQRVPERFRWRAAVAGVTKVAGKLRGLERVRVEEPVREMVLDLADADLRREVILDARKVGMDLDRGEVLPHATLADLRRLSFLAGVDVTRIGRYTKLPEGFGDPIDSAASIVVARTLSEYHRRRAHKLWLHAPDPDGPTPLRKHELILLERADQERAESDRWAALAKALIAGG